MTNNSRESSHKYTGAILKTLNPLNSVCIHRYLSFKMEIITLYEMSAT